jgi:hypothetical protein
VNTELIAKTEQRAGDRRQNKYRKMKKEIETKSTIGLANLDGLQ